MDLTRPVPRVIHAAYAKMRAKGVRIAIVDESGARATVLEEGLRDAGYDDIHVVPPARGLRRADRADGA